jgi:kynurenine formamidase
MAKIISVRCTGAGRHENEIDLENILGTDVVLHGTPIDTGRPIPQRIVRRCEICNEGKVVLTREMIEESL